MLSGAKHLDFIERETLPLGLSNQGQGYAQGDRLLGQPLLSNLLSCHDLADLGFAILDQLAADVHSHAVDLTGEFERRIILRCDR